MRDTTAISARVAITLYCAIQSRELLDVWFRSGYDRFAWLILLLWILPIVIPRLLGHTSTVPEKQSLIMMPVALLLTLIGQVGSLHIVQHTGLAIALASWVPFSLYQGLWIASAITWMPSFGWIGSKFFYGNIFPIRLLLVGTAAGLLIAVLTRKHKKR